MPLTGLRCLAVPLAVLSALLDKRRSVLSLLCVSAIPCYLVRVIFFIRLEIGILRIKGSVLDYVYMIIRTINIVEV